MFINIKPKYFGKNIKKTNRSVNAKNGIIALSNAVTTTVSFHKYEIVPLVTMRLNI
jgi:hypothetical protein